MNPAIAIRAATAEEVIDLRHAILRAGLPRATAVFAGDEQPVARHFVAVAAGGEIVGCVTLHPATFEGAPAWQLRGMAVTPTWQKRGVGARLLEEVERSVASDPAPAGRALWCNARVSASAFYARHGWRVVSDVFEIPSAGPHVRMVAGSTPRDGFVS